MSPEMPYTLFRDSSAQYKPLLGIFKPWGWLDVVKVHVLLVILGMFMNMNVEFFPWIYTFIISKCHVNADTALRFRFL